MSNTPADSALKAQLAGIHVPTRLAYAQWLSAFQRRWQAKIIFDTEEVQKQIETYIKERELNLNYMTFTEAFGLYAHHPLQFINEKHLAAYVADQDKMPDDVFQPLDGGDWNRIEHDDWLRNREPGRQIMDMGSDD